LKSELLEKNLDIRYPLILTVSSFALSYLGNSSRPAWLPKNASVVALCAGLCLLRYSIKNEIQTMYTVDSIALSKKDGSCMRVTNLRGATNIISGLHNVEFMERDEIEGTSNKMMIKYPKEGCLYILANEQ